MILQKTLQSAVQLEGVGLHSGKTARVRILPAGSNAGVVFIRTDLEGAPEVKAHFKNVINTQLATTLGVGRVTVSTVEHLLAALAGLGIDNALVEVDGPEVPILDGSSVEFVRAIDAVGTVSQLPARQTLVLKRKVEIKMGEKWAVAEPSARLEVHGSVEWDHPSIGFQEYSYVEGRSSFAELSSARTFGFMRDVEALQKMGLARGGSLANAVVLDESRILNPEGLRYPDEFARHKVLDALGDFKLAGIAIQAKIRLHRAGHDLHSQLLAAIFRDPANYEIVDSATVAQPESRRSSRVANVAARMIASV